MKVTATYSLKVNGKVRVVNKGYSIENTGKSKTATGTAWVPNEKYPGCLKVRFFWPFSGNYYVMSLDDEYLLAIVCAPSRKYYGYCQEPRLSAMTNTQS